MTGNRCKSIIITCRTRVVALVLLVSSVSIAGVTAKAGPADAEVKSTDVKRFEEASTLRNMLGEWKVSVQTWGSKKSASAKIEMTKDQTTITETYEEDDYHSLSIFRLGEDGMLSCWTFDSVRTAPTCAVGSVAASPIRLRGSPHMDIAFVEGGFDMALSSGSKQIVRREYRR